MKFNKFFMSFNLLFFLNIQNVFSINPSELMDIVTTIRSDETFDRENLNKYIEIATDGILDEDFEVREWSLVILKFLVIRGFAFEEALGAFTLGILDKKCDSDRSCDLGPAKYYVSHSVRAAYYPVVRQALSLLKYILKYSIDNKCTDYVISTLIDFGNSIKDRKGIDFDVFYYKLKYFLDPKLIYYKKEHALIVKKILDTIKD